MIPFGGDLQYGRGGPDDEWTRGESCPTTVTGPTASILVLPDLVLLILWLPVLVLPTVLVPTVLVLLILVLAGSRPAWWHRWTGGAGSPGSAPGPTSIPPTAAP